MRSRRFRLNIRDLIFLGKRSLMIGFAGGIAYFVNNISEVDMGSGWEMLVPVFAVFAETSVRFMKDGSQNVNDVDEDELDE